MPYFMLGIVLAAIISWYGWKKVCQIGNYESFYGFLMFWTMPLVSDRFIGGFLDLQLTINTKVVKQSV